MEKENIDPKLVLALMEREICRRALLMHLLMLGYEHFVSIDMLKRSMKTRKFTYEEAERLADTLERHMGIKVAPEKFIRDENEAEPQAIFTAELVPNPREDNTVFIYSIRTVKQIS